MVEMNYTQISGVVMLIIAITGGSVYLTSTGENTGCKSGWKLITDGERIGQYVCESSTPDRFNWCYELRNSSSTVNYWCVIGVVNMTDPEDLVVPENNDPYPIVTDDIVSLDVFKNISNINVVCDEEVAYNCVYTINYEGNDYSYAISTKELNGMTSQELMIRLESYFDDAIMAKRNEDSYKVVLSNKDMPIQVVNEINNLKVE